MYPISLKRIPVKIAIVPLETKAASTVNPIFEVLEKDFAIFGSSDEVATQWLFSRSGGSPKQLVHLSAESTHVAQFFEQPTRKIGNQLFMKKVYWSKYLGKMKRCQQDTGQNIYSHGEKESR